MIADLTRETGSLTGEDRALPPGDEGRPNLSVVLSLQGVSNVCGVMLWGKLWGLSIENGINKHQSS